jgi:small subunit ribosomal protein S4
MGSYHGPKARIQRRFGEVLIPRTKYQKILEKRPYPPGDHGKEKQYRSGRRSDYGLQLSEKQKLSFIFNIRESQMRNYFLRARRQPGNTGENLLRLLERRLDNMVYRAGFAPTIWAARQMVTHGHILIDGERVNLPSYSVKPGEAFTLAPKMRQNVHVMDAVEGTAYNLSYLSVDKNTFTATLTALPARDELPIPVTEQLVVEFYTRLT